MATNDNETHNESFSVGDCDAAAGESIGWARRRCNLTSSEVSKKLGLTEEELTLIESGKAPLTLGLTRRAARVLGFSFVQFVAHIETMLTGKPRAAIEIDVPHTGSESAMKVCAQTYAAMNNPDNREAVETVVNVLRRSMTA